MRLALAAPQCLLLAEQAVDRTADGDQVLRAIAVPLAGAVLLEAHIDGLLGERHIRR